MSDEAQPPSSSGEEIHDSEIVSLLTAHQLDLRYYVGSLMPGDHAVDDVVQQANTTLWKKRGDFELGTNFKAWAFSIARFEVLNQRKRQARDSRRLVFSEELEDIFAFEIPEEMGEELESRHAALKLCLTKLSEKNRKLILHRYFKRAPLQDYAAETGRSVGGIKVTLHRIRATLAECIALEVASKGGAR